MDKQELRVKLRAMRRDLSPEEQKTASLAVFRQLQKFTPYRDAACIMAYMACRGELSLAPVMDEWLARGRKLLLPRCEAPGVMTARCVANMAQLVSGTFGLMEPDAACKIAAPEEIELILVPGVAFDRMGHRLGQGGGYYDCFLAKTHALRVGICHDEALIDRVPVEEHDCMMDAVITPRETIWFNRHRRNGHG